MPAGRRSRASPSSTSASFREEWRRLYKADVSPHLSRELVIRAVAYRMQEVALGGLRPEPQRQLRPFDRATEASSIQPSTPDANREHADQACAAIALVRVATLTDIPSLIWSKKFPTRGKCGGLLGPDRGLRAMWGIFAGIGIWCALYPLVREWLEYRANQKVLADMRSRSARGDRWDALRGRWME